MVKFSEFILCRAILSPQCTPTDLFHSLHAHAVTKPFVDSHSICKEKKKKNICQPPIIKKRGYLLIFKGTPTVYPDLEQALVFFNRHIFRSRCTQQTVF